MEGKFTSIGEGLGSFIGYFIIIISFLFLPSALVYITFFYNDRNSRFMKSLKIIYEN